MANFNAATLTKKGIGLLAKAQAGRTAIEFTKAAAGDGFPVLADGTNASDDPARRPGFRALAEQGVASPLRRAAMTKEAVRAASRRLGLFTADKPRFSCLAAHVPTGEPITAARLDEAARSCGIL